MNSVIGKTLVTRISSVWNEFQQACAFLMSEDTLFFYETIR